MVLRKKYRKSDTRRKSRLSRKLRMRKKSHLRKRGRPNKKRRSRSRNRNKRYMKKGGVIDIKPIETEGPQSSAAWKAAMTAAALEEPGQLREHKGELLCERIKKSYSEAEAAEKKHWRSNFQRLDCPGNIES